MKYLLTALVVITFTTSIWAQSPEKMSYQAVIRDSNGDLVIDTEIGMRISILEESETGTAVYSETHEPTTNASGLVTVEIGTGTSTDEFTEIDWGNAKFFIKTETDLAGGSSYTIIGTSQLLSVPYALHSATADSIVGLELSGDNTGDQTISREGLTVTLTNGGTYTDSIYVQTLADVLSEGNEANDQIKNVHAPTDPSDAATKAYVDALEAKLDALEDKIKALEPPAIGDFRNGGVIFYIFQSGDPGYVLGETHGLVCAVTDQSTGTGWGCAATSIAGASGTSVGSGAGNTTAIVTACTTTGIAADLCDNLTLNTYTDWYLPSKDELLQMYNNKTAINATALENEGAALGSGLYWSSTEIDADDAWVQTFDNGGHQYGASKALPNKVRAIRTF